MRQVLCEMSAMELGALFAIYVCAFVFLVFTYYLVGSAALRSSGSDNRCYNGAVLSLAAVATLLDLAAAGIILVEKVAGGDYYLVLGTARVQRRHRVRVRVRSGAHSPGLVGCCRGGVLRTPGLVHTDRRKQEPEHADKGAPRGVRSGEDSGVCGARSRSRGPDGNVLCDLPDGARDAGRRSVLFVFYALKTTEPLVTKYTLNISS